MDLLKPIKSLARRGKKIMDGYMDEQKMQDEAQKLKEEWELAKTEKIPWDQKFDREETVYMGAREFGNIYSESTRDDARTPVRLTQTFIEAQIDLSIPDAVFKPVSEDDEESVKSLQAEVDYILRSSGMEEINSRTERDVKKYGMVVYKIVEDDNYRGYGYRGRPKVITIHPKNILWAAGTTDKDKAKCWYHAENETLQECKKRYGEVAAKRLIGYGERADLKYDKVGTTYESNLNKTNDVTTSPDVHSRPNEDPLAKYVIVEKWYLDDEDECGLTVFSGNAICLKKPKFYRKRKYNTEKDEYVLDEKGNEVFEDTDTLITENEKVDFPANSEVPRLFPKGPESIPIIVQLNIPRSKAIPGVSDTERVYDFEEAMKKMVNKHEERILKGNTKVLYSKLAEPDAAELLDNDDLNVIGVNDVKNFSTVEFKDKGGEALEFYQFLLTQSQYQMGINQVWQGAQQGEAKSGKAINALIEQTAGKISIKVNEKNIAYKRIYRVLCYFILCFSDGDLPYRLDNTLETTYGTFNRHQMLKNDKSGNPVWIDYDIEVSAEAGFPKTQKDMTQLILQLASGGYFDATPRNVLVWKTLTRLGFPKGESILQAIQEEVQRQQQIQEQNQAAAMAQNQAQIQDRTVKQQEQEIKQKQQQDKKALDEVIKYLPEDIKKLFKGLPEAEQMALIGGQDEG